MAERAFNTCLIQIVKNPELIELPHCPVIRYRVDLLNSAKGRPQLTGATDQ